MLVLMLAAIAIPPVAFSAGHREVTTWKASYFADSSFSGAPVVRPEFDLGPKIPEDTLGGEAHFVRWETVLRTGKGGKTAFMLSANGRSRMLINGRLCIDNWGSPTRGRRTRGVFVDLPPGESRITVEHVARVISDSV